MSLGVFIFLIIVLSRSYSFHIDTSSPIVYTGKNTSSYFGLTVALYPLTQNYSAGIFIGAPRADSKYQKEKWTFPGVLYQCVNLTKCTPVPLPRFGEITINFKSSWTGSSLDINHESGLAVSCAPRRLLQYSAHGLVGGCYVFNLNNMKPVKTISIFDSRDSFYYTNKDPNSTIPLHGNAQLGFSAHITKENNVLLGAPGSYSWRGIPVKCTVEKDNTPICLGVDAVNLTNKLRILNSDFPLLGYSSTSGNFIDTKLYYVAGAPKMQGKEGVVYIYIFTQDAQFQIFRKVQGKQRGANFGSSVTAGDTNNDGLDDLVVGAPTHTTGRYNEGAIYYYKYFKPRKVDPQIKYGYSAGGQFGACVQYLGDLDHDGFGDVAVAAPYEEDSGVVYIFRGSEEGLNLKDYSQRIVGKDIVPNIQGFGISISKTADIDENHYPDLAIGAHKSGNAVILRTRSIVAVEHTLRSFSSMINTDDKSFAIEICFWTRGLIVENINISRTITVDETFQMATLNGSQKLEYLLVNQTPQCQNLTIALSGHITTNEATIAISLDHEMIEPYAITKGGTFIPKNPVLSNSNTFINYPVYDKSNSSKASNIKVNINLACGDDKICNSNVTIVLNAPQIKNNTLIVGSLDHLTLESYIANTGENAYSTELSVIIPESVSLSQIFHCKDVNQTHGSVSCSVDNPLRENANKSIVFDLELIKIMYEDSINIKALAIVRGEEVYTKNLEIKLVHEANLVIDRAMDDVADYYLDFIPDRVYERRYCINKNGRSPINEVSVEFYIPTGIEIDAKELVFVNESSIKSIFSVLEYTYCADLKPWTERLPSLIDDEALKNSSHINCNTQNIICKKLQCTVGSFGRNEVISFLTLKMLFNQIIVNETLLKSKASTLTTYVIATILSTSGNLLPEAEIPVYDTISYHFRTISRKAVELWVIIVAITVGLLLLAAIIGGLIMSGFFKRAKKEQMEHEKIIHDQLSAAGSVQNINTLPEEDNYKKKDNEEFVELCR